MAGCPEARCTGEEAEMMAWSDWTLGALGTIIMVFSSWAVLAAPILGATGTIIMFFSSYIAPVSVRERLRGWELAKSPGVSC